MTSPSIIAAGSLIVAVVLTGAARPTTGTEAQTSKAPAFWLDRATEQVAAVEDAAEKAELYGRIGQEYARLGDDEGYRRSLDRAEEALAAAGGVSGPSPVDEAKRAAIPILISAKLEAGDVEAAKALAGELAEAGRAADHFLHARIAAALAEAGDVEGARAWARRHLDGGDAYRSSYYGGIAAAQAEAGDLEGALETADLAGGDYDRRKVLQRIARVFARRGDEEGAERVAEMLPEGDMEWRGVNRAIASDRIQAGRYAEALAVAEKLPDVREQQDVFTKVAEEQTRAGDVDAAYETVALMPLGEPRKNSLGVPEPPEAERNFAYTSIGRVQLEQGDIAGAKATAARFDGEWKPEFLRDIARAEVEAGALDDARRTAESIPDRGSGEFIDLGSSPRAQAFEVLIMAVTRRGDIDRAVAIAGDSPAPNDHLLGIASIASDLGRHEQARRIIDRITAEPFPSFRDTEAGMDRLHVLHAVNQSNLGNPAAFERSVGGLEEALRHAEDERERGRFRAMLLSLHLRTGRFDDAAEVARSMPEDDARTFIGWSMMGAIESGDLEKAEELASLTTPADRGDFFGVIADTYRKTRGDAEAMEWIERLPTPQDRAAASLGMAKAMSIGPGGD